MELILYRTIDAPNVINKTLTDPVSINIVLKNDVNIINPEIILSGDYRGFNYAHIPELNRFYFVESFEQINLRFGKLYLSCDVLETYKVDILNCKGIITRDIKDGDYGQVNANSSINVISTHESDVKLTLENSIVLTTLEVRKDG